jgi:hypothetical protein
MPGFMRKRRKLPPKAPLLRDDLYRSLYCELTAAGGHFGVFAANAVKRA